MHQPLIAATVPVWDAATRLFHWLLVLLIAVSYGAAQLEWFTVHFWSGYCVLVLLVFRLGWGVVGSETARFGDFLRGPRAVIGHLRHLAFGTPEPPGTLGHNPVGGWMVLVLLGVVGVQAVSGLFTTDDLFVDGPLAHLLSSGRRADVSAVHRLNITVLLALAGLHVLAVVAYRLIWRTNLIRPMITGRKTVPPGTPAPVAVSPRRALAVLAAAIVLVAAAIFGLPVLAD